MKKKDNFGESMKMFMLDHGIKIVGAMIGFCTIFIENGRFCCELGCEWPFLIISLIFVLFTKPIIASTIGGTVGCMLLGGMFGIALEMEFGTLRDLLGNDPSIGDFLKFILFLIIGGIILIILCGIVFAVVFTIVYQFTKP